MTECQWQDAAGIETSTFARYPCPQPDARASGDRGLARLIVEGRACLVLGLACVASGATATCAQRDSCLPRACIAYPHTGDIMEGSDDAHAPAGHAVVRIWEAKTTPRFPHALPASPERRGVTGNAPYTPRDTARLGQSHTPPSANHPRQWPTASSIAPVEKEVGDDRRRGSSAMTWHATIICVTATKGRVVVGEGRNAELVDGIRPSIALGASNVAAFAIRDPEAPHEGGSSEECGRHSESRRASEGWVEQREMLSEWVKPLKRVGRVDMRDDGSRRRKGAIVNLSHGRSCSTNINAMQRQMRALFQDHASKLQAIETTEESEDDDNEQQVQIAFLGIAPRVTRSVSIQALASAKWRHIDVDTGRGTPALPAF
ncbi:hypothetical protein B0H19DRAFT_1068456 [Mycena capillaripes]|nr:hypothetical protein B0H19DRAFT_1068456 [Mycena capillaripes]